MKRITYGVVNIGGVTKIVHLIRISVSFDADADAWDTLYRVSVHAKTHTYEYVVDYFEHYSNGYILTVVAISTHDEKMTCVSMTHLFSHLTYPNVHCTNEELLCPIHWCIPV